MILPKYKFDKIKPLLRDIIPTGLYVLMRNQYNENSPMELKEYLNLFRQYCTDEQIKRLKDIFKNSINIDIDINGKRLPFVKDKEEIKIDEDSSDTIKSIKFKHRIVTNLSNENSDKESSKNTESLDNKKIENIIKKSIKPSEDINIDSSKF